jgi:oligoendopeptidase F
MRIRELLEGKHFNDLDFVSNDDDGRKINFDLHDDLIYFMNHDDNAYRRHLYPALNKCIESHKKGTNFKASLFEPAVHECYNLYVKKYPIRELPTHLDEEICQQICDKIKDEVQQHIEEGKYKD